MANAGVTGSPWTYSRRKRQHTDLRTLFSSLKVSSLNVSSPSTAVSTSDATISRFRESQELAEALRSTLRLNADEVDDELFREMADAMIRCKIRCNRRSPENTMEKDRTSCNSRNGASNQSGMTSDDDIVKGEEEEKENSDGDAATGSTTHPSPQPTLLSQSSPKSDVFQKNDIPIDPLTSHVINLTDCSTDDGKCPSVDSNDSFVVLNSGSASSPESDVLGNGRCKKKESLDLEEGEHNEDDLSETRIRMHDVKLEDSGHACHFASPLSSVGGTEKLRSEELPSENEYVSSLGEMMDSVLKAPLDHQSQPENRRVVEPSGIRARAEAHADTHEDAHSHAEVADDAVGPLEDDEVPGSLDHIERVRAGEDVTLSWSTSFTGEGESVESSAESKSSVGVGDREKIDDVPASIRPNPSDEDLQDNSYEASFPPLPTDDEGMFSPHPQTPAQDWGNSWDERAPTPYIPSAKTLGNDSANIPPEDKSSPRNRRRSPSSESAKSIAEDISKELEGAPVAGNNSKEAFVTPHGTRRTRFSAADIDASASFGDCLTPHQAKVRRTRVRFSFTPGTIKPIDDSNLSGEEVHVAGDDNGDGAAAARQDFVRASHEILSDEQRRVTPGGARDEENENNEKKEEGASALAEEDASAQSAEGAQSSNLKNVSLQIPVDTADGNHAFESGAKSGDADLTTTATSVGSMAPVGKSEEREGSFTVGLSKEDAFPKFHFGVNSISCESPKKLGKGTPKSITKHGIMRRKRSPVASLPKTKAAFSFTGPGIHNGTSPFTSDSTETTTTGGMAAANAFTNSSTVPNFGTSSQHQHRPSVVDVPSCGIQFNLGLSGTPSSKHKGHVKKRGNVRNISRKAVGNCTLPTVAKTSVPPPPSLKSDTNCQQRVLFPTPGLKSSSAHSSPHPAVFSPMSVGSDGTASASPESPNVCELKFEVGVASSSSSPRNPLSPSRLVKASSFTSHRKSRSHNGRRKSKSSAGTNNSNNNNKNSRHSQYPDGSPQQQRRSVTSNDCLGDSGASVANSTSSIPKEIFTHDDGTAAASAKSPQDKIERAHQKKEQDQQQPKPPPAPLGQAGSLREEAKMHYTSGNYRSSVNAYTTAISLLLPWMTPAAVVQVEEEDRRVVCNTLAVLYGNRSAALMMLGANSVAAADCRRALERVDSTLSTLHTRDVLVPESGVPMAAKLKCRMGRAFLKAGEIENAASAFIASIQQAELALRYIRDGLVSADEKGQAVKVLSQTVTDATLGSADVERFRTTMKSAAPRYGQDNHVLYHLDKALSICPGSMHLHERKIALLSSMKKWADVVISCEMLACDIVRYEGVFNGDLRNSNPCSGLEPAVHLKADYFADQKSDPSGRHNPLAAREIGEAVVRIPSSLLPLYLRALRLEERYAEASRACAALESYVSSTSTRVGGSWGRVHSWIASERDKLRRTTSSKERGDKNFRLGKYQEAADHYSTCLVIDCEKGTTKGNETAGGKLHAILYCNRAACFMALRRYRDAAKDCSAALRIQPQYLKAMLRRGRSYARLEMFDEAMADYRQWIDIVNRARTKGHGQSSFMYEMAAEISPEELERVKQELSDVKLAMRDAAARREARSGNSQWRWHNENYPRYNSNASSGGGGSPRRRRGGTGANDQHWHKYKSRADAGFERGSKDKNHSSHDESQGRPPPKPVDSAIDLYAVLQVKSTSSITEIKKTYRKLALQYHPDKNKDPTAADVFRRIKAAYEILSDIDSKRKYDTEIRLNRYRT